MLWCSVVLSCVVKISIIWEYNYTLYGIKNCMSKYVHVYESVVGYSYHGFSIYNDIARHYFMLSNAM